MNTLETQPGMRRQPPLPESETYTPGHTENAVSFMSERNLASHGAFALPWLRPGISALDCGCGPGTITLGLADAIFPGQVTGIDLQSAQIEQARRLSWGLEQMNADFRNASVYELPFADGSFDFIFSHALFEHLARPASALAELKRVLAPGGLLALCSPDWDAFLLAPCPTPVRDAITAYRNLQAKNGGNTRAGQLLAAWTRESGFKVLEHETRFETYEDTRRIGGYLALQLENAGEWEYAHILKTWAKNPAARFTQAWSHVIARR